VTDNAALTYLGTLVPDLTPGARYALVAGAVAGGGLTVIANAPNPAGYGLLRDSFGEDGISPLNLFLSALPFTLLAAAAFLI
jgi:Na+/H+ antiporter NhaD/arsenite permease-like protein